ncbi:MAG: hypothetical protein IKX10_03625 [Lachnospiraceae bacterium]|nr:hypothetical protein [Lachnospiraceae bacterium]
MKKKEYTSGVTAAGLDEIKLGLKRMRELLSLLGDPQDELKIVHVAGTNGKGTVIAFLKSVLCKDPGRRVGVFTTPAVFDPCEVLSINGKNITPKRLQALTKEVDVVCEKHFPKGDAPSPFERLTAKAFLYFAREKTDIVLLETGLGGDLDATNAYDASSQLCAVLTSVGEDHMDFLGDTTAQIAAHKAGIFREDHPVILGTQIPEDAWGVVMDAARAKHCPVEKSEKYRDAVAGMKLSMIGTAAADNAACAYACLHKLKALGFNVTEEEIRAGFAETSLPGRFEIFAMAGRKDHIVILDGAHNLPAARSWAENINSSRKDYKKIIVCGMLKDKDHMAVLRQIASVSPDAVYFGATRGKRRLSAVTLAQEFAQLPEAKNCEIRRFCGVRQAFSEAMIRAGSIRGRVLVAALGSFTFIGALRKEILSRKNDDQ